MRRRKSGVRSLSVSAAAASPALPSRAATRSHWTSSARVEFGEIGDVGLERRLARNALGLALGRHAAIVDAVRQPPQPAALLAEPGDGAVLVEPLQIADRAQAEPLEPRLARPCRRPTAAPTLIGASCARALARGR